jgi:hypothetical protein
VGTTTWQAAGRVSETRLEGKNHATAWWLAETRCKLVGAATGFLGLTGTSNVMGVMACFPSVKMVEQSSKQTDIALHVVHLPRIVASTSRGRAGILVRAEMK